jgi:hypothetical protein
VSRTAVRTLFSAITLGLTLAARAAAPADAVKDVSLDACVAERKETAALMKSSDGDLVEVDLTTVRNSPFALKPDDCVKVRGIVPDNQGSLRRQFPQAGYLIQAYAIEDAEDHLNPTREPKPEEDRPPG